MALRLHELAVTARHDETADAVSLTFGVPARQRAAFTSRPGQYLTLVADVAGEELRRTYSIHRHDAAGPAVLVKRVPDGRFSTFVHEHAQPGMRLKVLQPAGTFGNKLDLTQRHSLFACAAGSGITPVLPLLEAALRGHPRTTATLVYGNSTTAAIIFRERLCDLKDEFLERLDIVHVLSQERLDSRLHSGRITAARARALVASCLPGAGRQPQCLLCGPEPVMQAMTSALLGHGVPAGSIHRELFDAPRATRRAPAAPRTGAGTCMVEVTLNGSRRTLAVPRGGLLLEALQAQGLEAPFSCTNGVCATCRARVRAGQVTMDINHALEPDEVAAGMVLACQARPASARLAVDFDGLWN